MAARRPDETGGFPAGEVRLPASDRDRRTPASGGRDAMSVRDRLLPGPGQDAASPTGPDGQYADLAPCPSRVIPAAVQSGHALMTLSARPTSEPAQADMLWIPGGTFRMGRNTTTRRKRPSKCTVAGFWIDKTPVTNAISAIRRRHRICHLCRACRRTRRRLSRRTAAKCSRRFLGLLPPACRPARLANGGIGFRCQLAAP